MRRIILPVAALFLSACSCGEKTETPDVNPQPEAAVEEIPAPEPVEVAPLPPPENDLTEVTVKDAATGGDKTFKIGDKVQMGTRTGMIAKRFNGVSDVVLDPPHGGEVLAIRTEGGLVDVQWDAATWTEYIAPETQEGDPEPGQNPKSVQGTEGKQVKVPTFVSPVHAGYLVPAGAAEAATP